MPDRGNSLKDPEWVPCDVLVVGGGGAGLRAAIAARSGGARDVVVVSKTRIGHACNTYLSKAIVAASGQTDNADDARAHGSDTMKGGRFLNDPAVVARMTERIPSEIAFLARCGVPFCREGDRLQVFQIAGHRHPRHVSCAGWKGRDLIVPLKQRARQAGIRFFEHVFVTRLFASENRIAGASGLTADGRFLAFPARSVVLATGGYGQIYRNTNNAPGITGDGHALGYHLGVPLRDMEFVQFYPTALGRRGSRLFLNEKLLAQEGVTLENAGGQDLFRKNGYADPMAVNRDRLAQMVFRETGEPGSGDGHAVMNLSGLSPESASMLRQLLPSSWAKGQRMFPVVPTAHYCMGGIATDAGCRTAVDGLYAAGEAAAGCHGANRLGGNSLAEVFSMGSVAGETAAAEARQATDGESFRAMAVEERKRLEGMLGRRGDPPGRRIHELKETLWQKAGIVRNREDLAAALDTLPTAGPPVSVGGPADLISLLEFENMRLVAEMVCRAALLREESRGSHFREDFPAEDDGKWRVNIEVRKGTAGMALTVVPVQPRLRLE